MDKTIYITLQNGICNRLLPLMSVLRFARTSNRKIICYWGSNPGRGWPEYNGHCDFLELFYPLDKVRFLSRSDFSKNLMGKNCAFYDFEWTGYPDYIVDPYVDTDIVIYNCVHTMYSKEDGGSYNTRDIGFTELSPSFCKMLSSYRTFFRELKPLDSIQKRIDDIKATFSDKMIGIHLRRTDGGFAGKNWWYTDMALVERVRCWVDDGYSIFIASDHPRYETMFGTKNIIFNKQDGKYNNDKVNTINAVIDLYLLSHCSTIIGTYDSTFSIVSYLLSERSNLWMATEDPQSIARIKVSDF